MVGFFDSQKKYVADCFPSEGVLYLGLSPREVGRWYFDGTSDPDSEDLFDLQATINEVLEDIEHFDEERQSPLFNNSAITLIAADGVHPNARCYTRWASAISRELVEAPPFATKDKV